MKNIKELRLLKRITQIEAARACGVSLVTFNLWEKQVSTPSPENLKKLEKLLME